MMDNQLTPRKITRLMNIAEGHNRGPHQNMPRRDLLHKFDDKTQKQCESATANTAATSSTNCESSSGILDLDCCEGLSSYIDNLSLGKSTFNPGEMTGRSTETEPPAMKPSAPAGIGPLMQLASGRHSIAMANSMEQLEERLRQQSSDVANIMRHSVCSSQFTQIDLTADERSFVAREGVVPVMQSELDMDLTKNAEISKADTTDLSLGGYFKNRCEPFRNILPANNSPVYNVSSVSLVSNAEAGLWSTTAVVGENIRDTPILSTTVDMSLDCVPVRQPRVPPLPKHPQVVFTPASVDRNKSYVVASVASEPKITNMNLTTNVLQRNENVASIPDSTVISVSDTSNVASSMIQGKTMGKMNAPTYLTAPQLQHLAVHAIEDSMQEDSLSMSAIICNYLGNESDVRASVLLNQINEVKNHKQDKLPLREMDLNVQQNRHMIAEESTMRLTEPKSTALTVDKFKSTRENLIEALTTMSHSTPKDDMPNPATEGSKCNTGTKSPGSKSSKSQSTYCTVQENQVYSTIQNDESPSHTSKGGSSIQKIPSPNILYKELDKSVDWQELLNRKRPLSNEGLEKVPDKWVEIAVIVVHGYVGVGTDATVKVTSLSDSWLTAKITIDDLPTKPGAVTIDLPRFPVLLSPGKSENLTFHITSLIELKKSLLPFTIHLRDSSIDQEIQQKGNFEVDFQLPVIQTVTTEGINKGIKFKTIQEGSSISKNFVLISDCSVDLQLDLSVIAGNAMFRIGNLQEIKRADIKTSLVNSDSKAEDAKAGHNKMLKQRNKQLCRLSNGNAIRATLIFTAPKFTGVNLDEKQTIFNGHLAVHMIGTNILMNKIILLGTVGVADLALSLPDNKLHFDCDNVGQISVTNSGTVIGTWRITAKDSKGSIQGCPFIVSSDSLEIRPGANVVLNVQYTGPEDELTEGILIFEDVVTKKATTVNLSGGKDRPALFPIKTTYSEMSWVREGGKELSLKNACDKKVTIRCKVSGDGYSIESCRGRTLDLLLTFGPNDVRVISVTFDPPSFMPHRGRLLLMLEHSSESAKFVKLHGCAAGPAPRWAGMVTCGETALVPAAARAPLYLTLHNRSRAPAFISARVHFNLQYMSVAASSRLVGAQCVVAGRGAARLTLHVDWARVERVAREAGPAAAATLATISVLTGAECTRRRILRILKEESDDEPIAATLSDHLSRLMGTFEGEDSAMDEMLTEFQETKRSLDVLVGGVQELSAQVDLPRDLSDDLTILISDETTLEHCTICD